MNYLQVVSSNPAIQARYEEMRRAGESHNIADVLAHKTGPGLRTDAIFNEGKFSGDAGRIDAEQTWLRGQSEAAGVSTTGKWYCRGLADFPGDPTAWVGDRGDVVRIASEKNMRVHGYVEHTPVEREPVADVAVGKDIIDDCVEILMSENPLLSLEAAQDRAVSLRTGDVDSHPLRCKDYFEEDLNVENW